MSAFLGQENNELYFFLHALIVFLNRKQSHFLTGGLFVVILIWTKWLVPFLPFCQSFSTEAPYMPCLVRLSLLVLLNGTNNKLCHFISDIVDFFRLTKTSNKPVSLMTWLAWNVTLTCDLYFACLVCLWFSFLNSTTNFTIPSQTSGLAKTSNKEISLATRLMVCPYLYLQLFKYHASPTGRNAPTQWTFSGLSGIEPWLGAEASSC